MPYTEQKDRVKVDNALAVADIPNWSAGDLTYGLTRVVFAWVKPRKNFMNIALVIGCLVCTILEFYRRVVAPYEDDKKVKNGDAF